MINKLLKKIKEHKVQCYSKLRSRRDCIFCDRRFLSANSKKAYKENENYSFSRDKPLKIDYILEINDFLDIVLFYKHTELVFKSKN